MSEFRFYPLLYPIRHLLGALGGALIVAAIKWGNEIGFKLMVLTLAAGVTLIILTFALKYEYLKRRRLLGL